MSLAGWFNRVTGLGEPEAPSAAELIAGVAAGQQFTALADYNHKNFEVREALAAPETLEALGDAGVKHIGLELPAENQFLADKLAEGEISKAAFVEVMTLRMANLHFSDPKEYHRFLEATADTIVIAKEEGISVHFVDTVGIQNPALTPEEQSEVRGLRKDFMEMDRAFASQWAEHLDATPSYFAMTDAEKTAHFKTWGDDHFPAADKQRTVEILSRIQQIEDAHPKPTETEVLKMRLSQDAGIANTLMDIAGDEKMVFLYGAVHLIRSGGSAVGPDVNDSLASMGAGVKTIGLMPYYPMDQEFFDRKLKSDYGLEAGETPDYVLEVRKHRPMNDDPSLQRWVDTRKNETTEVRLPTSRAEPETPEPSSLASPSQRYQAPSPSGGG